MSDESSQLGTIHGSNEGEGPDNPGNTDSRGVRLLTGVAWSAVKKGTTGKAGTCYFGPNGAGTLNGCTQHADTFTGSFNTPSNY